MGKQREITVTVPTAAEYVLGNGGWVRYRSQRVRLAYVRFVEVDGRFRPAEVYVPAEEGEFLEPRALRQVPLGDIEAWVNDPERAADMRRKIGYPGPNLRLAAAHLNLALGQKPPENPRNWIEEMHAEVAGTLDRQRRAPSAPKLQPLSDATFIVPCFEVPAGRDHGDDFYRQVAAVYGELTGFGFRPAPLMAQANGVQASTVHRWVKEARRRGLLPAARRGKAG